MNYSIPKLIPPTVHERVEQYVVANPDALTRDLIESLGITPKAAKLAVHRMQSIGKIHRANNLGERNAKWRAGPAPEFNPDNPSEAVGQPRQRTVKEWKPPVIPRDPWIWALHGAQP